MSSRCPSCQFEIHSDEFGLIVCPNCGAQIMAGMDDAVATPSEMALENPAVAAPTPEPEPLAVPEPIENEPPPPDEPVNLSDIAEYGNSPISQARDGTLRFHIYLTNIDTADVRKAVREILADSRFLFDVDQIINSIRNGEVKISDVTPVKAAILIQRLRPLAVGISWEQYAIHSA